MTAPTASRSARPRGVRQLVSAAVVAFAALSVSACSSAPMKTAEHVDLTRFMGDWYVLAHIPTSEEKNAWNAVESYRLADGTTDTVEVTFAFREGAFDGKLETMRPTGHVSDDPAKWGMHFYWWQGPFRFQYLVVDVDAEYQQTVIGRSARDYVWIMARTPTLTDAAWTRLVAVVKDAGYDTSKLRRVPQRWGEKPDVALGQRESVTAH